MSRPISGTDSRAAVATEAWRGHVRRSDHVGGHPEGNEADVSMWEDRG